MSIAKRVEEALEAMSRGDPEAALIPASIATAATTDQEQSESSDNQRYKAFLHDNLEIITRFGFGSVAITQAWNIKYEHPDLRPNADGLVTIEQILYHVVRCGLIHGAQLPANLHFTMKNRTELTNGMLTLPGSLVYGLVAAVVGAKCNAQCAISDKYALQSPTEKIALNDLWGRRDAILRLGRGEKAV